MSCVEIAQRFKDIKLLLESVCCAFQDAEQRSMCIGMGKNMHTDGDDNDLSTAFGCSIELL